MEYCQAKYASNEFEIAEMIGVDAGVRIDLQCVVVMRRVFEQTVTRVEYLVREKEEPFSVS